MLVNFDKKVIAYGLAKAINEIMQAGFYANMFQVAYSFSNGTTKYFYPYSDPFTVSADFDLDSVYLRFVVQDTTVFSFTTYPVELNTIEINDANGLSLLVVNFDVGEFVINNSTEISKLGNINLKVLINV